MLDCHSQFDPVFSVRLYFDMKSAQTQDTGICVMCSESCIRVKNSMRGTERKRT